MLTPEDFEQSLRNYESQENRAAQIIQRAYRKYAAQQVKTMPRVPVTVKHAAPAIKKIFEKYLHGQQINRARGTDPNVTKFYQHIINYQWAAAFSMPNFIDYAVTLFMFGRFHVLDFYNIIDVFQVKESQYGKWLLTFANYMPPFDKGDVFKNLRHTFATEYDEENDAVLFDSLPLLVSTVVKHLTRDQHLYTRTLRIIITTPDNTFDYFLFSMHNVVAQVLEKHYGYRQINAYQPHLLGDLSPSEIDEYSRGQHGLEGVGYVRPASVWHPDIPHLTPAHNYPMEDRDVTEHDRGHRLQVATQSDARHEIIFKLMDTIRNISRIHWSYYLWSLLDLVLSGTEPVAVYLSRLLNISIDAEDKNRILGLDYYANVATLNPPATENIVRYFASDDSCDEILLAMLFYKTHKASVDTIFIPASQVQVLNKLERVFKHDRPVTNQALRLFELKQKLGYCHLILKPIHAPIPTVEVLRNLPFKFIKINSKLRDLAQCAIQLRLNHIYLASVLGVPPGNYEGYHLIAVEL